MSNVYEGQLQANGLKIGIIVSRFNDFITSRLLEGSKDCLRRHGLEESDLTITWVPGAFEIPLASKWMAQTNKYDALICLGAVIRGSTTHYELVCSEATKGISQVSLQYDIPVSFGIITTENIEQAIERAGTKAGNKGQEAALSAIEMGNLARQISK